LVYAAGDIPGVFAFVLVLLDRGAFSSGLATLDFGAFAFEVDLLERRDAGVFLPLAPLTNAELSLTSLDVFVGVSRVTGSDEALRDAGR